MNQRVFGSSSAIAVSAPSSTTRRERGDRSDSPVEVRHGTDRQNPKTTAKTAPRSPQHPRDYRSRGSRLTTAPLFFTGVGGTNRPRDTREQSSSITADRLETRKLGQEGAPRCRRHHGCGAAVDRVDRFEECGSCWRSTRSRFHRHPRRRQPPSREAEERPASKRPSWAKATGSLTMVLSAGRCARVARALSRGAPLAAARACPGGLIRLEASETDAFELWKPIHHYKRSPREPSNFCEQIVSGWLSAARML